MPTPTNVGGPSALPYQLIKYRPDEIKIDIYTYNNNSIASRKILDYSKNLCSKITVIKTTFTYNLCNSLGVRWFLYRFRSLPFQTLITLNKRIRSIINANYDYVWVYPHYLLGIAKQIKRPMIITGPDSSVLHYIRCLEDSWAIKTLGEVNINRMLYKQLNLESAIALLPNGKLHFVGENDLHCFLSKNCHGNAFFLRHPSNMPEMLIPKKYSAIEDTLSIIITGQLNIYTGSDSTLIVEELCKHSFELRNKYRFTFVGKGWDNIVYRLRECGYKASVKLWVNDYFGELLQHDIQLFPISVGTGTKGKVLDALSAGILCVGSHYAFENIQIEDGVSGYRYDDAHEISNLFMHIYDNRGHIADIAQEGYRLVCDSYNPSIISKEFFERFI